MSLPLYPGRNSTKDVAARLWNTEDQLIPALQENIDGIEEQVQNLDDAPDFTLILQNALT